MKFYKFCEEEILVGPKVSVISISMSYFYSTIINVFIKIKKHLMLSFQENKYFLEAL